MIQAAVAFVDESKETPEESTQPLYVWVNEDEVCSFASPELTRCKNPEPGQLHVLFQPSAGPVLERTMAWIPLDRPDLPLKITFDFYQEQSPDSYFGAAVVTESVHAWAEIPNAWEIPVPCRGDLKVSIQVGDRLHKGQLAYSTKSLLNPMPRINMPGLMLMEVNVQQGDMKRFSQIPSIKLLKLYAGAYVVHVQLQKVTVPEPVHQDRRHRTMVYKSNKVMVIPRSTASLRDLPKQCLYCCESAKLKCSVCGIFYCSVKCQKEDWKSHKRSHV
jgi:hypothetical protein